MQRPFPELLRTRCEPPQPPENNEIVVIARNPTPISAVDDVKYYFLTQASDLAARTDEGCQPLKCMLLGDPMKEHGGSTRGTDFAFVAMEDDFLVISP